MNEQTQKPDVCPSCGAGLSGKARYLTVFMCGSEIWIDGKNVENMKQSKACQIAELTTKLDAMTTRAETAERERDAAVEMLATSKCHIELLNMIVFWGESTDPRSMVKHMVDNHICPPDQSGDCDSTQGCEDCINEYIEMAREGSIRS